MTSSEVSVSRLSLLPRGWCSARMCASGVAVQQQQQQHAKQQHEDDPMAAYTHTGLTDRLSEYVCSSSCRLQGTKPLGTVMNADQPTDCLNVSLHANVNAALPCLTSFTLA